MAKDTSRKVLFKKRDGFIATLQKIIVDWKVFLKTAGNLSIVDLLNMAGIRLLSFSSIVNNFYPEPNKQKYCDRTVKLVQQQMELLYQVRIITLNKVIL